MTRVLPRASKTGLDRRKSRAYDLGNIEAAPESPADPAPPPPVGQTDGEAAVIVPVTSAGVGTATPPVGTHTGSMAVTATSLTAAASATAVNPASTVTGSMAVTATSVTSAASGTSTLPGTEIFRHTVNGLDATQANWNTYLGNLVTQFPLSAPTRKAGHNAERLTLSSGDQIWCGHNNEVTSMLADGTFVHERFDLGAGALDAQKHSQLVVGGTGDAWDGFYLRPNRVLEFNFQFELIDDVLSLADYKDNSKVPWLLLSQLWTRMKGASGNWGSWTGGGKVPMQIIIDQPAGTSGDNKLLARVSGSNDVTPVSYGVESEFTLADLTLGAHDIKIDTLWNYQGIGSYMKIYLDGELVASTSQSIGVNADGGNARNSMLFNVGLYSSGDTEVVKVHTGPIIIFDST